MIYKTLSAKKMIIGVAFSAGLLVGMLGIGNAMAEELSPKSAVPHYSVNQNGQTYGKNVANTSLDQLPDLIAAIGDDGTQGYLLTSELYEFGNSAPKTPAEALARAKDTKSVPKKLTLYASDGKTVLGEPTSSNGNINISKDGKTKIITKDETIEIFADGISSDNAN